MGEESLGILRGRRANSRPGAGSIKGTQPLQASALELGLTLAQLSATSHFTNDLGLDSLDTVEVVMAIEEVRDCDRQRNWQLGLTYTTGVQH